MYRSTHQSSGNWKVARGIATQVLGVQWRQLRQWPIQLRDWYPCQRLNATLSGL